LRVLSRLRGFADKEQVAKVAGSEQTVGFCGQRAGCQGCGFNSRLRGFAGKKQGAKVAGCEQRGGLRTKSRLPRLRVLSRLWGFAGKEQVAKVAGS
jgi:hypothetical protein